MKFLLPIPAPTVVNFAKTPFGEVISMPVEEINQRMKKHRNINRFEWGNNIKIPDNWNLTNEDNNKIQQILNRKISDENLVVTYLNEEIGFIPYTNNPVKKGQIIFYAGEIFKKGDPNLDKYSLYKLAFEEVCSDGQYFGDFSSLCPDLYPSEIQLTGLPINVARNNFVAQSLDLSCGSIPYLEAETDLPAKTICALSYGKEYWNLLTSFKGISKLYLTDKGEVIKDEVILGFLNIKSIKNGESDQLVQASSIDPVLINFLKMLENKKEKENAIHQKLNQPLVKESEKGMFPDLKGGFFKNPTKKKEIQEIKRNEKNKIQISSDSKKETFGGLNGLRGMFSNTSIKEQTEDKKNNDGVKKQV